MDTQIITIYCLCDDMLKAFHHRDDPQCQMTDAEVMTTALVAALFYGGNFEKARDFLQTEGYIPAMLSKSRFNRRLYRLEPMFHSLFDLLGRFLEPGKSSGWSIFWTVSQSPPVIIIAFPVPNGTKAKFGVVIRPAKSAISMVSKSI